MPDKRLHRGKHPEDDRLFDPSEIPALTVAVWDLSMLLSKGYPEKSSLKLVGDHFNLTERQRTAVARCSCSDSQLIKRQEKQLLIEQFRRETLVLDGYNILITIEAALSGAYLFRGRDGCIRDLSGIHGTYKKVTETLPALNRITESLKKLFISRAIILLDSPVSNSGRLKTLIRQTCQNYPFEVEVLLLKNPDSYLKETDLIIASSDSAVLDECSRWINFTDYLITEMAGSGCKISLIDLSKK